jgi:hypothetical protein
LIPPLTCELPCRLRDYIRRPAMPTQIAIDRLHLLHYAERFEWTRPVQISQNGIVINSNYPSEVLRYLHRDVRSDVAENE